MLSCIDAAKLISEKLDHKLPLLKYVGLCIHLIICKACSNYSKQILDVQKVTSAYFKKKVKSPFKSAVLSKQAKDRIKKNLTK